MADSLTASLDRYHRYRDETLAKPHETLLKINIPYLEAWIDPLLVFTYFSAFAFHIQVPPLAQSPRICMILVARFVRIGAGG